MGFLKSQTADPTSDHTHKKQSWVTAKQFIREFLQNFTLSYNQQENYKSRNVVKM